MVAVRLDEALMVSMFHYLRSCRQAGNDVGGDIGLTSALSGRA